MVQFQVTKFSLLRPSNYVSKYICPALPRWGTKTFQRDLLYVDCFLSLDVKLQQVGWIWTDS